MSTPAEQSRKGKKDSTQIDSPRSKTIHQVFEEQAKRCPEEIAVSFDRQHLTYEELNSQANKLAAYLSSAHIDAGSLIGICLDRSLDMVVGLLGVLKAGFGYVPLDPAYPVDRIKYILDDAAILVVLTQTKHSALFESQKITSIFLDTLDKFSVECFEQNHDIQLESSNIAYVIYTSGSTGNPKGVLVSHFNVVRLFTSTKHWYNFNQKDVWTLFHSYAFDFSVWEIWGALFFGGRLVIVSYEESRSPKEFYQLLVREHVTVLNQTPSAFRKLIQAEELLQSSQILCLRLVIFGGEALELQSLRPWFERHGDKRPQLVNMYGITETTVHVTYRPITIKDLEGTASVIGCPIPDLQVYVLDKFLSPVAIGDSGELFIGGAGVAQGYLNRADLTAHRFIDDPFKNFASSKLYRSGDLVRYLPNLDLEYLGRIDTQVKIRGFRIELGEVEAAIGKNEAVLENVVIIKEEKSGYQRLVSYVVLRENQCLNHGEIRRFLKNSLPDFMIPDAFVFLDHLPLTINGKVDRKALPAPSKARPQLEQEFIEPITPLEKRLSETWKQVLIIEKVGIYDSFFDLGGTSLLSIEVCAEVEKQLNILLQPVKLYQYSTIHGLARYISELHEENSFEVEKKTSEKEVKIFSQETSISTDLNSIDSVSIIGMVGRFPGANDINQLWENLCNGVESTLFFEYESLDSSINPQSLSDSCYVRARGILEDAENFDALFFGISPREAEMMDPQSRVFLELAFEALENSGYMPDSYSGLIGLFAGSGQNTYFEKHLCNRPELIESFGEFQTMLANEKDFLATRTSYKLGLTGPSLSINTACSTSLVAVIQAFSGLINRQCDIALAGGISISTPQNTGYFYQEGGMLSPDGKCRPFDADAKGTMFNNGAGIVVLKRTSDALRDRDCIYAVLKGVGLNNDGSDKVSFTAPSVNGQIDAIKMAHKHAGFDPETITYVEAHGTATPLGDPIELEALTQAFRLKTNAKQFCAVGSIKSNIGHVVAAAGVAGLIKTALSIYNKKIIPSLNYLSPNPQIDFANSPFYVNTQLIDWKVETSPRRAGVSSFGVGGTNAHVVLEEAPYQSSSGSSRPYQLLLISAKTESALQQTAEKLKNYFEDSSVALADAAYTLQQGRRRFNYRRFVVCRSSADALEVLHTYPPQLTAVRCTKLRNPDVVFMFPGQGSQYVEMGLNLYRQESVFRNAVDRCAKILEPFLKLDIKMLLYPAAEQAESAALQLRQTIFTQPALFTVEYAMAMLWQSWGIQPAAMIGHSIGEFVAACLAGVFTLEDALMLVATRGRMMWELPCGSMLSVRLSATEVEPQLNEDMAIAAINGPSLCVVSGPTELVAELQKKLESREVICKPLHTSHAFHSPMMDEIVEPFLELLQTVQLYSPSIPFISTVTATWITHEQAMDPLYWAKHLRATVRFAEGVKTLWENPHRVLLEVGPRTTAATLARQQATDLSQQIAISSLGNTAEAESEWLALTQAIGQLWLAGVEVDWKAFYADETRSRVPLPTYPFERQRYWIDAKRVSSTSDDLENPPEFQLNEQLSAHHSIPATPGINSQIQTTAIENAMLRQQSLIPQLKEILEDTSGLDISSASHDMTFLEMGLDSLSLTQVAITLKKKYKVKIAFRNLLEDYPTVEALATFLDQTLPAEAFPEPDSALEIPQISATLPASGSNRLHSDSNGSNLGSSAVLMSVPTNQQETPPAGEIASVVAQQLQIMSQQLELLRGNGSAPGTVPPSIAVSDSSALPNKVIEQPQSTGKFLENSKVSQPETAKTQKLSGPGAKIDKTISSNLTTEQRRDLDRIIDRYISRTSESKRQTQEHRHYLADPRTVSGFSPLLKEMVYPIVVDRSSGSKLWDVDGNEYVDITNGFGLNFFGWNPDFVKEAVIAQMEKGFEIGPQTPLAGKVAKLVSELTGMERVAFCNTGSEAVMATLRLARTVTGRDLVATFAGDYHGTFDEVLYRPGAKLRTMPGAPGILPCMFENLLILDYGAPESLEILRSRADDLAAVLIEPVRSRNPGLQPKEFLKDLRRLTEQSGTAYIFDEVVTGFRVAPGGAQAYFDIQADMATYGKVVGGGLPIGIVAGKAEYLDALDGGLWQYGDDSVPEVGVTFFAGTFVRHPMALAAAEVVLEYLKKAGPELQTSLNAKVNRFVTHLKQYFERIDAPFEIEHFSSFFYLTYPPDVTYGSLLFYLLRERGVHAWENRPCFLTLSHTDEDIEFIVRAFKDSVAELQASGLISGAVASVSSNTNDNGRLDRNRPPKPGARLGRDPQGNPDWYIPDPDRPGKYMQVGDVS